MVEIRCSDRAFASAMTVLVDVLDETFPGFDEVHDDVSAIDIIFPGDDLSRLASMVGDPDGFMNGTWNRYTFTAKHHGLFNFHRRTVMLREQPDITGQPIIAVQKLMMALDFPQAKCVMPGCPCNGAGTMLDYWAFLKDKPVTSKTTMDILNGITDEWKRRVAMVSGR